MIFNYHHLWSCLSFRVVLCISLTCIQSQQATQHTLTPNNIKFAEFTRKLFESEELNSCTIQLLPFADKEIHSLQASQEKHLQVITSLLYKSISPTNSILISEIKAAIKNAPNNPIKFQQPKKVQHTKRCQIVLVVLIGVNFSDRNEQLLKDALINPILNPPTTRNHDKYLILTESNVNQWQESKVIKSLKFKLMLVLMKLVSIYATSWREQELTQVQRFCQYGLCQKHSKLLVNVDFQLLSLSNYGSSTISRIFPDHEKNFFGKTLRLSTTTKVPQLLELKISKADNGRNLITPKRGLYLSVLRELSKRLNFSYEIVPSSGGGSTGHALPNGTWVGIVGDTYNEIVDFGFMAAITYSRFPYAEFCAPINFAYIGFVTGPPRKSYAWNAILWPFNPGMWVALSVTILISAAFLIKLLSLSSISNELHGMSLFQIKIKWSYLQGIAFLARGLLEQCAELPKLTNDISFRTFLTIWLLFCLVCSTVYRSKMVSLLTFPLLDHVPETFDELALTKGFAVDFHYFGNVGYAYFKTSTNPSFVQIYKKMGREPSPLKCLNRTIYEKTACIIFITTFEELLHRNLSDKYGRSPLKFNRHDGAMFPAGVIHQYKASLSTNFRSVLFSAMETGIIPFWLKKDLKTVLEQKNRWHKENNITNDLTWGNDDNLLRVRNLLGAFGMLAIGIVLGIFAFVAEKTNFLQTFFAGK